MFFCRKKCCSANSTCPSAWLLHGVAARRAAHGPASAARACARSTMIERRPALTFFSHAVLWLGVAVVGFPVWLTFVASTQTAQQVLHTPMSLLPGGELLHNYGLVLAGGKTDGGAMLPPVGRMLWISFASAMIIAVGKIAISLLSAFAIVYFRFPLRQAVFWAIFVTLMLPVEVRIGPTYQVVSDLRMLNSYAGLTVPLIASATATFLFRQFFLTVPDELAEAARIDGAGPMRFFFGILLPLSVTNVAAMFVIQFIYGWNQYLWPLLVTTEENMYPVVMGIKRMISGGDAANEWNLVMATAMLAMLPPALVVLLMQRWFVKGLVETEK
jgi:sn-glycerol 3-phosphate transport system permease protein